MQLTCPHCQKTINVSQEEIALRGGTIVCPQCLGSYHIDTDLTAEQVLAARGKKAPECPQCRRTLPADADISFCPYCGTSLRHVAPPTPEPVKTAAPERSKPAAHHSHHSHHHSEQQRIPLVPTIHYHHYQEPEQPASLRFQAAAWAVIIALLAVLVFILYQSYKLQIAHV